MAYIGRELRQDQAARTQFTATGSETSVNVNYTPGQLTVFLNGIKLLDGTDFTASNGTSIALASALATDDVLDFIAYDTFTVADVVPASTGGTFAGNISVPTATSAAHAVTKAQLDASAHTPEGTAVLSTGESGGTKFLREDGDGTSSWQAAGSPSITDGGNAMAITIDSSENVGIGIAPTSYKLTVDGDGSRIAFSGGGSYPFLNGIRSNRSGTTSGNMYIETWRGDGGNTPVTAIAIEGAAADVLPGGDNTQDLGSSAKRWKNIYTTDLHLANDRGNWTVIEEEDYLTIRNNKTNKVFKLVMEEIE
tara:strand:- start:59 stop:982 length:924 start_codon:yes stop_codon:yes gene_type:complete